MKEININEISKLPIENVIDVRDKRSYEQNHIEGVKNIPMMGLIMNSKKFLKKDEAYYIMCHSGGRSHQTCLLLEAKGYDVVNLVGGISGYKK